MEIFIFIVLVISSISLLLNIILLLKSKKDIKSDDKSEILLSLEKLVTEANINQKSYSDTSLSMLNEMNRVLRDQMQAIYREERERGERENEKSMKMLSEMNLNFDRIRESNKEALLEISKKSDTLAEQVKRDMDKIRRENDEQLERMRATVDEKLSKTLDERLSHSFDVVNKNLESLYKSLGEMNNLARDVGNLNKMFSNIKSRGTWGEVQAEAILSDILTPSQYVKNYSPKNNGSFVEFAIKLPGKDEGKDVYLPIDSKFPKDDFVRYQEAIEKGDESLINESLKALKTRITAEARDIRDKYIAPPRTTDFAILFVPTESLYAELLRLGDFAESIQSSYKVVLTGPTNFAALINSLQMGFKTLLVEKNTKKVWDLFAVLKHQFSLFGADLEATRKSLESATSKVEKAVKRNDTISGKLQKIELPDDVEIESKEEILLE